MKVANQKYIRHLSLKSMQASKTRNLIAILSIALTTILFTSLFTVAFSINRSFQESNFRQGGGWSHGTFKNLTKEQYEELKDDSLIKKHGLRRIVGIPSKAPFQKSHVEIGYSDANQANWMYCNPVKGRLPKEGTMEAATDTRVLQLLNVEPVLGNEFTLTFNVDGTEITKTFTLCGWWDYDEAIIANHVLIPQSLAQDIFDEVGIGSGIGKDEMTGAWGLDVMLGSSMHIEQDMIKILLKHGYQVYTGFKGDNIIRIGVNWGYSGAQLSANLDPPTTAAIVGLLLIISFTGYLIIYNIFHISVSNDIRFYGLLKTIGTTGRQLRQMIRQQALLLSLLGIPIGLLLGYGIGVKLVPVVQSQLNTAQNIVSASPQIFIGSALFSLITVLISCRRPGRMAGKVSPIEAVRYTEAVTMKKTKRKGTSASSLPVMAWVNLSRSRSKTVVTVISLSFAILLLNMTVTFTSGFDMDKYLVNMVSDFILSDAGYFQTGMDNKDGVVPEELISAVEAQPGVEAGGRTYKNISSVEEFVTEDYYRSMRSIWNDAATVDFNVLRAERNDAGLLSDHAQLYGMEQYELDKLTVLQGDLTKLYKPGGRYVAAVYSTDDYNKPQMDSHWARVGDTINLRYVEEYEYYDPNTGEILDTKDIESGHPYNDRAKTYRDVEYEVAALVCVPNTLSYRYYGSDEFILNDQTFIKDTGTNSILYYACDVDDENTTKMEHFLSDLTTNQQPEFDYESKLTYAEEFYSFQHMFLLLGGVLSFIIGLIGILNFLNAILTGILTRRREFAMLQSIGMTGRQLKTMLIYEGLYYALGAVAVSLLFSLASAPLLSASLGSMFWFVTYRFTLWPVFVAAPVFALLGILLPLIVYRAVSRQSIVERLRESE